MNKHERAVEGARITMRLLEADHAPLEAIAIAAYTLRVLEAVEGVEEWMVRLLKAEAKAASTAEDEAEAKSFASAFEVMAVALQAILDAKADPNA